MKKKKADCYVIEIYCRVTGSSFVVELSSVYTNTKRVRPAEADFTAGQKP